MKRNLMTMVGLGAILASTSANAAFVGFSGYYDVPVNGTYTAVGTTSGIGAGSPGWTLVKTSVPLGVYPAYNTGNLQTYGPGSIALHGSQKTNGVGTLLFTILTHYAANENGFKFDFNGTESGQLHAGDDFGYVIGASYYSLKGSLLTPRVVNPAEGQVFGFYVNSAGDELQPDLNIANFSSVPEPATMALNGLVLAGAAAGWAWNRRRKAA